MELSQRLDLGALGFVTEHDEKKDAPAGADTFAALLALCRRVTGEDFEEVSANTALEETALSSLDRIELAIRIEQEFGVRISEQEYAQYETVGALADYVGAQRTDLN